MKKILLISFLFIGCKSNQEKREYYYETIVSNARVVARDGCEYLVFEANGKFSFTHHGSCKNPKHYFKEDKNYYKYNIVLPEEYPLISTNINHPDTFTAYASRDTIYFQFDNLRNGKK